VNRSDNGKVKIVKKHETPTRMGGGLLAATTGGGAALGALAGHAAAGMSHKDLEELGEHLETGLAESFDVGEACDR
jgi:hypothetical protein